MTKTINKASLVDSLVKEIGFNKNEAKSVVEDFFEKICAKLEKGENVKISGFGHFVLREKGARPGRNPKTGEPVTIVPKRVVTFKAGQKLKSRIAENTAVIEQNLRQSSR